jgi:hypothetical protein
MKTTIVCTSKWIHRDTGKVCKVVGKREENSRISEFHIDGYNPLPCFTFKGTYTVLADWLKENGWIKIVKADVYSPDIVFIHYR